MPHSREGASGSFGAPLDELLPKLGGGAWGDIHLKVDVHRKPKHSEPERSADRCRIFVLNQKLYEQATR
jgi:hypothetical protein